MQICCTANSSSTNEEQYVGCIAGQRVRVWNKTGVECTVNDLTITPHTEGFQAVIWHLIVSHPELKEKQTKWESVTEKK